MKKDKCPKCGQNTYLVSFFGSICTDSDCFYEPEKSAMKEIEEKKEEIPSINKQLEQSREKLIKEIIDSLRFEYNLAAASVGKVKSMSRWLDDKLRKSFTQQQINLLESIKKWAEENVYNAGDRLSPDNVIDYEDLIKTIDDNIKKYV